MRQFGFGRRNPILNPPASLHPNAQKYGTPEVAPVTRVCPLFAISLPTARESSSISWQQGAISAAPETTILYFALLGILGQAFFIILFYLLFSCYDIKIVV
ncbi:MAG: hypothetical protein PHG23_03340, partial [Candidatus Pacebacteria bacterium]|nr:hypothetical protein [Candidatus Paceibacterota bacterium]